MDLSKFCDLYIEEGREHSAKLSSGLRSPNPAESSTVNELFRHAHSLKGMAASMSFTPTSSLAHSLESLLALWREGKGPTPEQRKAAIRAADTLEALMDVVQENGNDSSLSGVASSVEKEVLAVYAEAGAAVAAVAQPSVPAGTAADTPAAPVGNDFARLKVSIDPSSPLPAARLLVVFKKLKETHDGCRIEPDIADIQRKNLKAAIFLLPPNARLKEVARSIKKLPEVTEVGLEEAPAKSADAVQDHRLIRSVRVSTPDLDLLLNQTGDLLCHLNEFEASLSKEEKKRHRFWLESHRSRMNRQYERVLSVRLIPFDVLVERVGRTIRELSEKLSKQVRFEAEGADQRIDSTILERLLDPLLHLVRNALDHGLETREERLASGKAPEGLIRLELRREADAFIVSLSDDGRGIDTEAVRRTAVDRGLYSPTDAAGLAPDKLLLLLTTPAFTTRKKVTQVSGRGVGLDVVRSAAESLGGHLDMESERGSGSRFTIVVPSAVTLTNTLIFGWKNLSSRFALPTSQIRHIYPLSRHPLEWSGNVRCLQTGEELLPILPWRPGPVGREGFGLGIAAGKEQKILLISSVYQAEKVMILPWRPPLEMVPGWIGGALLSTGELAYVLDGRVLVKRSEETADV